MSYFRCQLHIIYRWLQTNTPQSHPRDSTTCFHIAAVMFTLYLSVLDSFLSEGQGTMTPPLFVGNLFDVTTL